MAIYKHEALDLDSPGIRLVRLLRGSDEEIHCEIFQAWLYGDGTVPYEALSYAWGDPDRSMHSIRVNGELLPVTRNLYNALHHLQQNTDRVLWIDAICIDQDNEKERGHQVGQMSTIYKQAERVIIWLGLATFQTNTLMDALQHLQDKANEQPTSTWGTADKRWEGLWSEVLIDSRLSALISCEGLEILLRSTWFERVWVLQEVANARYALVCCGSKSVSSRTFALAPFLNRVEPNTHCQAVLDILPGPSRQQSWWSENRDLYTLLLKFRGSKASDPRDMMFALLGISSDTQQHNLCADYTKTEEEVIREFQYRCFGYIDKIDRTMSVFLKDVDLMHTQDLSAVAVFDKVLGSWSSLELAKVPMAIERGVFQSAAQNKNNGKQIIQLLMEIQGGAFPIRVALDDAVRWGNKGIVQMLLDIMGVDINAPVIGDMPHTSTVEAAFQWERYMLVKGLVRGGAIITIPWILRKICRDGLHKILQPMLDNGASVNLNIGRNHKPLQEAARFGRSRIVQILLSNGADINAQDRSGETPLHAATRNNRIDVVRLLLNNGANANALNSRSSSVLRIACRKGFTEIAGLLLDNGAPINANDEPYGTPLLEASLHGDLELVKILLAKGADTNRQHQNRVSPIQAAAWRDFSAITLLLLKNGADINAHGGSYGSKRVESLRVHRGQSKYFGTPFEEAVCGHSPIVMRQLLKRGAAYHGEDEDLVQEIKDRIATGCKASDQAMLQAMTKLKLRISRRNGGAVESFPAKNASFRNRRIKDDEIRDTDSEDELVGTLYVLSLDD